MSVDNRTKALALNLLTFLLASAGLVLSVVWTYSGYFSFEISLLGLISALTVIAAGLTYYYQVSKP